MLQFFMLAGILACTQAQRVFVGNCPDVSLQENFMLEQYMGKWYEHKRYFAVFELFQDCVTADYALQGTNNVSVLNKGYNRFSRQVSEASGDAITTDPENPAKLGVKLGGAPVRGDYWVVSTDYTTYTIVWSCTKVPFLPINTQFAWVLTREPVLEKSKIDEINAILDAKRIDKSKFALTSQVNCPGRALTRGFRNRA